MSKSSMLAIVVFSVFLGCLAYAQFFLWPRQKDSQAAQAERGQAAPPSVIDTAARGPRGDRPPRPDGEDSFRPPGQNRQAQDDGGRPEKARRQSGPGDYSIEQAVSDRAQLHTIAFDGLAFLTGSLGCDSFLPPGKVADYFGFQHLRDIDGNGMGHNTNFLTRAASNVLHVLTDAQVEQLITLGREQAPMYEKLALARFPAMQAFRRNLEGDYPAGRAALSSSAVEKYSADLYLLDGDISYRRAAVVGAIVHQLDSKQRAYLDSLAKGDSESWPDLPKPLEDKRLPHEVDVLVMTYASELLSWYLGDVEADTYFCPERHGMYFGGFYLKDFPAMGKRGYSISTSITGDLGEQFLATLTPDQSNLITEIVELQRQDLQEIVTARRAIAQQLRLFMEGKQPDRKRFNALAARYGELDGKLSYLYASRFAEVGKSLSKEQLEKLRQLRNLDTYPDGAYRYSEPISMPQIASTDSFFAAR